MLIKKLEGLPQIEMECPSCNHLIKATMFSRAFSSDEELICLSCGVQAGLSLYSHAMDYLNTNKISTESIEKYFRNCECGGHFVFVGKRYDMYRCPSCKKLINENLLVAELGLDTQALKSGVPFCAHVEIDDEEIDFTNPGIETIGHIDEEIWNVDINDQKFHEALKADRELRIKCTKEEETFKEIKKKIANGVLPQKIYLMADLHAFMFIRVGDKYFNINPSKFGLPVDLIDEYRYWARLGSYIEEGIWGEGDYPPESFTKTNWEQYFQVGLDIQKRLQAALTDKAIVELLVDQDGEPFFKVEE